MTCISQNPRIAIFIFIIAQVLDFGVVLKFLFLSYPTSITKTHSLYIQELFGILPLITIFMLMHVQMPTKSCPDYRHRLSLGLPVLTFTLPPIIECNIAARVILLKQKSYHYRSLLKNNSELFLSDKS